MSEFKSSELDSASDYQAQLQHKLAMAATLSQQKMEVTSHERVILQLMCGQNIFVCPLSRVIGVVPTQDLLATPQMPMWHKGILLWQGRPVSVIDAVQWGRQKTQKFAHRTGEQIPHPLHESLTEKAQRIVLLSDYLGQVLGLLTDQIIGPIKQELKVAQGSPDADLPYFLEQNQWWVEYPKKGFV